MKVSLDASAIASALHRLADHGPGGFEPDIALPASASTVLPANSATAGTARIELAALNSAVVAMMPVFAFQTQAPVAPSFADQVRSGASGFDLVLAQMCQAASDPDAPPIEGWRVATDEDLPPGFEASLPEGVQWLPNGRLVDTTTGLDAVIYTDGQGNYVLVFPGTDPASAADWGTNISQATGGIFNMGLADSDRAYSQATELTALLQTSVGEDHLAVTGYSLGGGMAAASAWVHDVPAVTFNAAGVNLLTLVNNDAGLDSFRIWENPGDKQGLVRNYVLEDDLLTGLQEGMVFLSDVLPDALGDNIVLDNGMTSDWMLGIHSPLAMHGLGNVITALQTQVPSIVEIETIDGGTRVVVLLPTGDRTFERVVVEFDATAEGQAALQQFLRDFPLTGSVAVAGGTVVSTSTVYLGPWVSGDNALQNTVDANSAIVTENSDGSKSVEINISGGDGSFSQVMYFRPDGTIERIETQCQYRDGATVRITQHFDADGKEIIDQRRYAFTWQNADGATVTYVLGEQEMQALFEMTHVARFNEGNGVPMLDALFTEAGDPLVGEGTLGFALSLARADGLDGQNRFDDYLRLISQLGDGDNDWSTVADLPAIDTPIAPVEGPMP